MLPYTPSLLRWETGVVNKSVPLIALIHYTICVLSLYLYYLDWQIIRHAIQISQLKPKIERKIELVWWKSGWVTHTAPNAFFIVEFFQNSTVLNYNEIVFSCKRLRAMLEGCWTKGPPLSVIQLWNKPFKEMGLSAVSRHLKSPASSSSWPLVLKGLWTPMFLYHVSTAGAVEVL